MRSNIAIWGTKSLVLRSNPVFKTSEPVSFITPLTNIKDMLTLESFSNVGLLRIPHDAYANFSQNMISCSTPPVGQEYCKPID